MSIHGHGRIEVEPAFIHRLHVNQALICYFWHAPDVGHIKRIEWRHMKHFIKAITVALMSVSMLLSMFWRDSALMVGVSCVPGLIRCRLPTQKGVVKFFIPRCVGDLRENPEVLAISIVCVIERDRVDQISEVTQVGHHTDLVRY